MMDSMQEVARSLRFLRKRFYPVNLPFESCSCNPRWMVFRVEQPRVLTVPVFVERQAVEQVSPFFEIETRRPQIRLSDRSVESAMETVAVCVRRHPMLEPRVRNYERPAVIVWQNALHPVKFD